MLQMDKNGDFYYLEALKSEVRRTEADGDIIMMMEENRKLKIALIKEQVINKTSKDQYNIEQEEALAFINDRAAEYTQQRYMTLEKHENEIDNLKVTLKAERAARATNLSEIRRLKKKLGEDVSDDEESEEKVDDYGVAVDPDAFMDLVSGVVRKGGKIADEALKMGYLHLDTKTKEEYREKNFWGKLRSGEDEEKVDKRKLEEEKRREEKNMEVNDLSEGGGVIKGRAGRPDMKVIAETSELEVSIIMRGAKAT